MRSRLFSGSAWLVGERVAGAAVGIGVLVLLSRHLSPEDMGRLGLAQALVTFVGVVANLGLDVILVRDLVRGPERRERFLGATALLQLAAALVGAAGMVALVALVSDDAMLLALAAVLSASLLATPLAVIESELSAQNRLGELAALRAASYGALLLSAVAVVLASRSLLWFALPFVVQAVARAAGAVAVHARGGRRLRDWSAAGADVRQLLRAGLPLMASAAAVALYATVDRVMVSWLAGAAATGEYFVAARLSEGWHFLPMAVVAAAFPELVRTRDRSPELFAQEMQRLFNLMVLLALAVAVPIALFADLIVALLYGTEYAGAAAVLRIHVWSNVLVFLGVASGRWLVLEGRSGQYLARTIAGVGANVGLNFALIPPLGAPGAAVAAVLAQFVVVVLSDAAVPATHPMLRAKLRAMAPFWPVRK